jgi:hypothetical protein
MRNMNEIVGKHDLLFITIDALRFDVAQAAMAAGRTPNLARAMAGADWEERHSPGNFTLAAHQAFFAGFLPTPVEPGSHARPFALQFAGSQTITEETCVFDAPDIVSGLAGRGYHTVCIGGVGFFNKRSPLGNLLPSMFQESHWEPEFGVTDPHSAEHQVDRAVQILNRRRVMLPVGTGGNIDRVFLFINFSAVHQPNRIFVAGATGDSSITHEAALAYIDSCLPPLFGALAARGPAMCIVCSDHGTAYGEDGYVGHRLAHPVVWTVPYAEFSLTEGDAW